MKRELTRQLIENLFCDFDKTYKTNTYDACEDFWNKIVIAKNWQNRYIIGDVRYYDWKSLSIQAYQIWFNIEENYYTAWYYYTLDNACWLVNDSNKEYYDDPLKRN